MQQVEWGEFKLDELFKPETSKKRFDANKVTVLESGKFPYVVRTSVNNGQRGYIDENEIYLNDGNTISFGQDTATMFYQEKPYFTGDKIKILRAKHDGFNRKNAQFFISAMEKTFSSFSWGSSSFNVEIIKKQKILLPTKNGKIDFEFMESFIAELEAQRIAELEAYLLITGLKDYTLTTEEQHVLKDFEQEAYGEFLIDSIFEKLNLKNHNKAFDKLKDTSTTKTNEFNLSLVNAKLGNNGIMFYGREKDFDSAEMTIDVISNGAVATGTVYAQPYKTGVLWDAYLLKPIAENMSKQKLLYMATALQKSIKTKFGWEDKAVWSKVQHETILLPTINKQPNYAIMEIFISAIQKLVIKDVVLYADKKIAATKKVVNI